MKQDRHGACDGCDRLKKLTLIHGRGLCINCEVLWDEAQKATEKRMLDEIMCLINEMGWELEDLINEMGWGLEDEFADGSTSVVNTSELERILRKKYEVSDE